MKNSGPLSPGKKMAPDLLAQVLRPVIPNPLLPRTRNRSDVKTTHTRRQSHPLPARQVTPLAANDDLMVDLMYDALAGIEPEDISDLLELADIVHEVEGGTWTVQTVVTGPPSPVDSSNVEMGVPDDGMADLMMDAIGQAGGFGPRAEGATR